MEKRNALLSRVRRRNYCSESRRIGHQRSVPRLAFDLCTPLVCTFPFRSRCQASRIWNYDVNPRFVITSQIPEGVL